MISEVYNAVCNLLRNRNKVRVMAILQVVCIAMALTACSREHATDTQNPAPASETQSGGSEERDNKDETDTAAGIGTEEAEADTQKSAPASENKSKDNKESHGKIELSMEEAIALGMEVATKYYNNLMLTEVHSYDNDRQIDSTAGMDGKRQWWYVSFGNAVDNYVDILICDGKVESVVPYDSNANNGLIRLSNIHMTTEAAAKRAQQMGLTGGNPDAGDWASGYNFKLEYGSLVETPDDRKLMLEVIGISPNGNFAHIEFDAVTGDVLLAEEKLEYGNGEVAWRTW